MYHHSQQLSPHTQPWGFVNNTEVTTKLHVDVAYLEISAVWGEDRVRKVITCAY